MPSEDAGAVAAILPGRFRPNSSEGSAADRRRLPSASASHGNNSRRRPRPESREIYLPGFLKQINRYKNENKNQEDKYLEILSD